MSRDLILVDGDPEAVDAALTIAVTEAKAAVDAVAATRTASREERAALLAHSRRAVLALLDVPGGVEAALATLTGDAR